MSAARQRRSGLLRDVAIQAALIAAVLVAFEIALRLVDLRYLREGQRPGYSVAYRYDADLGWFPIAHSGARFTGLRTITIAHNSLGLRDVEFARADKPVVLVLGDSFVWGYDVEADERFTERLRQARPDLTIVNAGVSGYGTDQQLLLLQRLWDRIRPDAVVLMFCVDNDRRDNSTNNRYDGYYKPYFADRDGALAVQGQPVPKSRHAYYIDHPVVRHSWVARTAVAAAIQLMHPRLNTADPTDRLIALMDETVTTRGAKFLVGLQRPEPQLEAVLKARDIPYLSMAGAAHYHGDGDHWTPEGHAFVAERLQTLFERAGIAHTGVTRAGNGP